MAILLRNKKYHLRRDVPIEFRSVEPRKEVWISLKTGDREDAELKAAVAWRQMLEGWQARLDGQTGAAEEKFAAARKIARRRGFQYVTIDQVVALPLEERLARAEAITIRNGSPDRVEAAALSGIVPEPGLSLSKALKEFWRISVDETRKKTPDQLRRWENPKKKAFANLIAVVGDKELADLSRADMSKFRDWWNIRIGKGEVGAESARKDFTHIAGVLRKVNDDLGLDLNLPVGNLKIKVTDRGTRLPFSVKWIKTKILAEGALDGLNNEARTILLACVNTGARPSEIAGLMKHHINLSGPVPYISIEPEGRELKNSTSARRIPLVGCSLKAVREYMKSAPAGEKAFPSYFGKDKLSAVVNKFMRENSLLETDKHTLYGLRHSFEDRMTAAEPAWPERMKADVFGHALSRQRYGEGASLEHVHKRLQEIAL